MRKTSHSGMIIIARFSRKSEQATPTYSTGQVPEGSGWPLKFNYKHMKSSMTKTSHSGMIIISEIPSDH